MIGSRFEKQISRKGIDEYTVLMLHGEDFTDSSQNKFSVTNHGGNIDSSIKKFGNGSILLKKVEDDYLTGSWSTSPFTGDFTFEYWFRPLASHNSCMFCCRASSGSATGFGVNDVWNVSNNTVVLGLYSNGWHNSTVSVNINLNSFTHIAYVRKSGVIKGYVNGVQSYTWTTSTPFSDTGCFIGRGVDYNTDYNSNGYLDEFRISDIARWTSDFTPPTEPYSVF